MLNKFLLLVVMIYSIGIFAAEDFIPIQEKALGQSLAGAPQLNDSLYSNPAASSLVDVYSVDGSYMLPKSFAVSVLDTKTSSLGGAVGYFRKVADRDYFTPGVSVDNQKFIQGAKLAFMGRLSNQIGLGIAGKSIWGPDTAGKDNKLVDADVGAIFNSGFFQMGATIRNILGGKQSMKLDRELSLGSRLSYNQILSLSVAAQSKLNNPKPYQIGVGAEYVSPFYFALRGGYRSLVEEARSFWGVGASFVGPKLSVHYSLEMPNQSNSPSEHMFGTTMLF